MILSGEAGNAVLKNVRLKKNPNFAPLLPDRLMAGLQILVLTMLVRIQLGQHPKPFCENNRAFCF